MRSFWNLPTSIIAWLIGIITLGSQRGKLRLSGAVEKTVKLAMVVHMCNPSPPESEQEDHCYEANTDCIVRAPSQNDQEEQAEEMAQWLRCLLLKCET